jgi:hypothetical protein
MSGNDLRVTDGSAAGAWIKPRLGGKFGAVTLQVPKGFEAYARVFHPASDTGWNPVRWAEVADAFGTTAHRAMQWHALLGLSSPDELGGSYEPSSAVGSKWAGHDPPVGAMDLDNLDALCEILIAHTADPSRCYFGLCTIHSWLDSFSVEELEPLLQLPYGRDHIVLAGPLSAIDQIEYDWSSSSLRMTWVAYRGEAPAPEPDPSEFLQREAPNLIWPADRSWLVASEVDFDSTIVGGSTKLIEAIVGSSELEAWQVEPTDSLASDADKVNVTAP